jgi:hypothetical protein
MTQTDTRGAGDPNIRWCALCGAEYVAGVVECADCAVPLVEGPPLSLDDVGDDSGEQLAYEMDDLDAADRLSIDRTLAERGIVHAWDGTTLVVAPYDEGEVDAVLGGADEDNEAGTVGVLDDDEEQVLYDLADWHPDQRNQLAGLLHGEGITHAFDEHGDLIVLAADEDRVDGLVDGIDNPDQLPVESDGPGGLAAVEALGALFVAADRLVHDPSDSEGVVMAADSARTMASLAAPFGFVPKVWEELVAAGQQLRQLLETEAEVVDDEAVVEAATTLRATLRPYV